MLTLLYSYLMHTDVYLVLKKIETIKTNVFMPLKNNPLGEKSVVNE